MSVDDSASNEFNSMVSESLRHDEYRRARDRHDLDRYLLAKKEMDSTPVELDDAFVYISGWAEYMIASSDSPNREFRYKKMVEDCGAKRLTKRVKGELRERERWARLNVEYSGRHLNNLEAMEFAGLEFDNSPVGEAVSEFLENTASEHLWAQPELDALSKLVKLTSKLPTDKTSN